MSKNEGEELDQKENDSGYSEEEEGVAEVRDADGRLGWRGACGVGKECGLVFGTDGRAEDGYGDGGFF
jgi:hypothetical protein